MFWVRHGVENKKDNNNNQGDQLLCFQGVVPNQKKVYIRAMSEDAEVHSSRLGLPRTAEYHMRMGNFCAI